MRKYLCEFIGTAVLVLFGCGTAAITGGSLLVTALAFGLSIVAMAYVIGNISGCHVNPAVSLAMLINGKISVKDFIGYVIAQVLGGFAGIALFWAIISCTSYDITLFDVLSGFDEIKVCTHYQIDGKNVYTIPASNIQFKKCVPVYEVLKGWKEDISNVKSFDELPENAKKYIEFIEKETGLPVSIFSVGPDKYQTIIRKEIF